jgi:putative DNA primase/helicase
VCPRGTLVEEYLTRPRPHGRGLDFPSDIGGVVRFHPACPWRDDGSGELIRVPAMLAAMRNIHTDEITGVHRTRLTSEGRKIGRKMMGVAAGAAIKLDADAFVTTGLTIGEGIETCLAARQLGFRPVWALGSADAIGRFPVLNGIEALTLLEEGDATGANRRAISACATRWDGAGREVILIESKAGGDINDALQGRVA